MTACIRRDYAYWTNCPCTPCRRDQARKSKLLRVGRLPAHPGADVARDRLLDWDRQGYSLAWIASVTGLRHRWVSEILHASRVGRPWKMGRHHAAAVLAADIRLGTHGLCSAVGARRRLQALARLGWSLDELAVQTGLGFTTLNAIQRKGVTTQVKARVNTPVREVYDRLCMTPGQSSQAAARAKAKGYAPPLAWDEFSIDDPAAVPAIAPEVEDDHIDELAVELAVAGDRVTLTPAERDIAIRRLVAAGLSDAEVAARLHVVDRTVLRWRQRLGVASSWAA